MSLKWLILGYVFLTYLWSCILCSAPVVMWITRGIYSVLTHSIYEVIQYLSMMVSLSLHNILTNPEKLQYSWASIFSGGSTVGRLPSYSIAALPGEALPLACCLLPFHFSLCHDSADLHNKAKGGLLNVVLNKGFTCLSVNINTIWLVERSLTIVVLLLKHFVWLDETGAASLSWTAKLPHDILYKEAD